MRIARELEKRDIKTATGKDNWHGPNVRQVLARELGDEAWATSIASLREERGKQAPTQDAQQ